MSDYIDLTKNGEKGEFVTIPAMDMYDYPHPKVQINRQSFLPGQTYKAPAVLAKEVKRILASKNESDIRLLRPRKDRKAINAIQGNTASANGIRMDQ